MQGIRNKARALMQGFCQVCPVCNGRACAGEVPGMGGLDTGTSFMNNLNALAGIKLNMRVLHDVARPDTRSSFLGLDLSMPLMAAPIGGVSFNMSTQVPEIDYTNAVAKGCLEAGIIGCLGDSARDEVVEASFKTLETLDGQALIFFKPWAHANVLAKLKRLKGLPVPITGMDVDAAGLITLSLMAKPVSPKTPADLKAIIDTLDIPFIVKGVMTPDEALLALEAGAKAIVVSNHGGRVLDHTPGTAEVLPTIAQVVQGRMKIIVDGGVRFGSDILKMLALGADLVMIGRPIAIAAIGGGAQGVSKYLEKIRAELITSMIMTGCQSLQDVGPRIIARDTEF